VFKPSRVLRCRDYVILPRMSAEINVATNRGRPPSKVVVNSCEGAACHY
jgi:hypothetical protein